MKLENRLIGHQLPQRILYNAIVSHKFGHSYLFSGESEIGKRAVAFAVAKTVLCQRSVPYCGQCSSCLKADQRTHPDLFEISPEGAFIKFNQVKQIQDQMILQPALGSKKIFIIDAIDQMNPEAANSFLKSLEEPPDDTHFLLMTSRPQAVLPTLFSRCQQIRFSPPSQDELSDFLIKNKNLSAGDASHLAKRSQGKVGLALSYDIGTLDQQDELFFQLIRPETLESPSKLFQLSEELSRDTDHLKKTVEWILLFLRDMILWKNGSEKDYLILDRHWEKIRNWAERFSLDQLYFSFSFLQRVEKLIPRNINRPLALETVLLQLYPIPGTIPCLKESKT